MTRLTFCCITAAFAIAAGAPACGVDTAPQGARATPPGDGPAIVFDTARRPLPEIPQPNDVATFADPTSRTGRRINVSEESTTRLETVARTGFNALEGWGTTSPITVAFQRDDATPLGAPAIDVDDVASRTRDYDPTDDPFYVIDLTTGVPAILDMGKGNFPLTVTEHGHYWTNDARPNADSLVYETNEEGFGLLQPQYRAALDTDFDGNLDHPNVLRFTTPTGADARIEDVIPWYERQTDTLIVRPVVPLEEMHEYAVVLTDRLRDAKGEAVRSPFPFIHHPTQKAGAERVGAILSDASKKSYYGDLSGTGLDHVAFVWTFTTQPVYEDMRLLRDGLHGAGPFAHLATEYPPTAKALRAVGLALNPEDEPPGGVDADPTCAKFKGQPYAVHVADARDAVQQFLQTALGLQGAELDTLMTSLDSVDHFVIGELESPYFMGDPEHEDPDGRFELDFKNGTGRVVRDTVPFWISVPKATATQHQPFPVTMWAHGSQLHADEMIIRAGFFAQQGQAMMAIDMPGHGLYLDPGLLSVAQVFLRKTCMVEWVTAIGTGRDRDLNGDGVPDSGGLLWTAHVFHARDNIRQSVVDAMQATRVLRAFDGVARSDQDYNADGRPDLMGDFDGDGVPDLGGPNVPITTSGNSFGGVIAMVHGAVDSNVVASAPISGGGGVVDVATRSSYTPDLVLEQVFTPIVVSVPAGAVPKTGPNGDVPGTRCNGDQRSVRFVLNDLTNSRDVEIACVEATDVSDGKTVVLTNLRNKEKRCGRVVNGGRFRVPMPANVGDRLDLQIYDTVDAVTDYASCTLVDGAVPGRRISTFEQAAVQLQPIEDESNTCDAAFERTDLPENTGCAQFTDRLYPVGSPLVAPQEGLGLYRQSPEARRLFNLVQTGTDASDPMSFAPYYALRPAPGPDGKPLGPRAVVAWITSGDPIVPSGTAYAFARAAGALPFLPPSYASSRPEWSAYATPQPLYDQLGGRTPNEVLLDEHAIEGVARLGRTSAGPACAPNYVTSKDCTSSPGKGQCATALSDIDWLAEGANLWDAPHPKVPLRLARDASVAVTDDASLVRAWLPRLTGAPFVDDAAGWQGSVPLLGVLDAYVKPTGQHVFVNPQPCKAFDDELYHIDLLVRFLATQGKDLYALSHPKTHHCLEKQDCPFFAR